jgi:hypothetical protein
MELMVVARVGFWGRGGGVLSLLHIFIKRE